MKLRKQVKEALGIMLGSVAVAMLIMGIFFIQEARFNEICESGNAYYCVSK